jgi:dCMP deaminase
VTDTRPDWHSYFMQIADVVSTRSTDPNTKHGCVLVDKDRRIIATGYNGPPQGVNTYPTTRPEKYDYFIHAEENAVLFCREQPHAAYITGPPCSTCARMLIQAGVKEIYYGPRHSHCLTDGGNEAVEDMAEQAGVRFVRHWWRG